VEEEGAVEEGVCEAVVAFVEAGDATEIAFGDAGEALEDLEEEFVWEEA